MNIIPLAVRKLFAEIFQKLGFSNGSDYRQAFLDEAESEEEREDLKELFQSTDDYYAERQKLIASGKQPGEYLKDAYMEAWAEQNPNAGDEERKHAEANFYQMLEDGALKELEGLQDDGTLRLRLEKKLRKSKGGDK